MVDFLNKTEIQLAQIDEETKINMVLESLLDVFNEFKVNYNLNKMRLAMVEFMNEMHANEEIYKYKKLNGACIWLRFLLLKENQKASPRRRRRRVKLAKSLNLAPKRMASRKAKASSVVRWAAGRKISLRLKNQVSSR